MGGASRFPTPRLYSQLLENLKGLNRGIDASPEAKKTVDRLASELERLNPTASPLGPELTAKWELLYTTSDSILGTSRPAFLRPWGTIYQSIDAGKLTARNQETAPFFNAVEAELEPLSKNEVNVQFKTFYIFNLIPITAPASAQGRLAITYLDDDIRVSRGNRGNLFILRRA
jgi:hypothetical protein